MCSIDLLRKIKVDASFIQSDYLPIRAFNNVGKLSLGTITLPIKVDPIILSIIIHIMLDSLTYNLVLGRSWIHVMQAVPSTLHQKIKFVYENDMYNLETETNLQSCLQTQSQSSSISSIFSPIQTNAPSPTKYVLKEELLEDDWGSLDFTPSLCGGNKMPKFET